jgi:hypothetical protein
MSTVQLLLHREAYARNLSALLEREGCFEVVCSESPDFERDGVIVADHLAIVEHPVLLKFPERLVLITPNDQRVLDTVWRHNIRAVVFDSDSPHTALLAILGSELARKEKNSAPANQKTLAIVSERRQAPAGRQICAKRGLS